MRRHGPHLLALVKGIILCIALILFIRFGYASEWRTALDAYFFALPLLAIPAYWASLIVTGFILTFPFTLTQDHLARAAEGQHEEMPATYWLHGLGMETLMGTIVGSLIVTLMMYVPSFWWLAWTMLWVTYHFVSAHAPELSVIHSDDDEWPAQDHLAATLRPILESSGIHVGQVYSLDEPLDEWAVNKDLFLKFDDGKTNVYLPEEWIAQWETDELAAVILHKAWLTHHRFLRLDLFINSVTSLACFGLFAALEHTAILPSGTDPVIRTTALFAWSIAILFVFHLPALAYYRQSMITADNAVIRAMGSPDALLRVLERAHLDAPPEMEAPRWAEILFYNIPPLSHRIQRMKSTPLPEPTS